MKKCVQVVINPFFFCIFAQNFKQPQHEQGKSNEIRLY